MKPPDFADLPWEILAVKSGEVTDVVGRSNVESEAHRRWASALLAREVKEWTDDELAAELMRRVESGCMKTIDSNSSGEAPTKTCGKCGEKVLSNAVGAVFVCRLCRDVNSPEFQTAVYALQAFEEWEREHGSKDYAISLLEKAAAYARRSLGAESCAELMSEMRARRATAQPVEIHVTHSGVEKERNVALRDGWCEVHGCWLCSCAGKDRP